MRVDLFDFDLPEDRIALRPAQPRDASRMLRVPAVGPFEDLAVRDLPSLLRPGDAVVFNDTKVIPAQLEGLRIRDGNTASFGATLHMRKAPDRWMAFIRGAKKLKPGDRVRFGTLNTSCLTGALDATIVSVGEGGEAEIAFDVSGPVLDEAIASVGHIPLPPYIASKRADDERDRQDYQTVFAREEGAVAAPTAGLHFTPELIAAVDAAGAERLHVTLHVGAGTFLPVKADTTDEHRMHSEIGHVSNAVADRLNALKSAGGRIICVGTTSLRLIESAASDEGMISPWSGPTDIFITPGYRFRAVDCLMTNFHLPRSTLFMLVSAFCGLDRMQAAYRHAIDNGYRFYSYGDASFLERAP